MKTCSRCGIEQEDSRFYKNRRTCKTCYLPIARKWQIENPEKHRKSVRASQKKAWDDPLKRVEALQKNKQWRESNPEWVKEHARKYYEENPDIFAQHRRLRAHKLKQQTPSWADKRKIKEHYIQARALSKETGIHHCVDHIIPLQGEFVSGLHVENNLQILTKTENSRKHNKYVDYYR